ncbi:C40 family peptidase [Moraxella sp. ZJ142]|uniref:C40 family peptidase n=1 Tax=Moraxella marmotae TaxID=3344520 RepID=UPI0035D3FE61
MNYQIFNHAWQCYPSECCGLVINGKYHPCTNAHHDPKNHFEISADEYLTLESLGEITAIVHSHPDGEPLPSEFDRVQMGLHGVDWWIVGLGFSPTGQKYQAIQKHKPTAYQSPLIGRDYIHGVQDCYTLVRDYYARELAIDLPDFERADGWWEDENHEPLYQANFAKAGFVEAQTLQKHDVILCRVGRTQHINHALIYLGDGKLTSENASEIIGDNIILHHPHSRLSVREIYGENWQRRTAMVVRHTAHITAQSLQ